METIDFVIPWVDGNDPLWKAEFLFYKKKENGDNDATMARYRDWGTLKYWFRGVEAFAPWVSKIFFITNGQVPEWLNLNNPKLRLIKHSDYIPSDCLPVFSSHPIELNLHRIKELSEYFVYFNDDLFLLKPVSQTDFFRNGLPVDRAGLRCNNRKDMMSKVFANNARCINQWFNKKEVIKKNFGKWFSLSYFPHPRVILYNFLMLNDPVFSTFSEHHLCANFLKSTLFEVWEHCPDALMIASHNRFRSPNDVSQWLFKNWQIAKGSFYPYDMYKLGKSMILDDSNVDVISNFIRLQKKKIIAINDSNNITNVEYVKEQLLNAFQSILPHKSSFEM